MTHSPRVRLATEAAGHPHAFAEAFNTFDPEALDQVYEPDAGFVPEPGRMLTGAERLRASEEFLRLRVPIRVTPRHTYTVGDLALLIMDWTVEGTAADGSEVRIEGTATDVARRGPDGYWRYALDIPFGTAPAAPS
ncbi:nuclear transport factor 2 family protein [Streptomyces sp. NA02950]|uniref:YybH family protein n=1 Tax=Streptomyces sp. NA02950 TaxID=2742137 RepID=UPI0015910C22|nr:nuclear transport factor 2 family protein [Streptomyces sp. NA02950]QKV93835.1 nuclear transport factor 2 family protein [Streptomyces sp. NA02950]